MDKKEKEIRSLRVQLRCTVQTTGVSARHGRPSKPQPEDRLDGHRPGACKTRAENAEKGHSALREVFISFRFAFSPEGSTAMADGNGITDVCGEEQVAILPIGPLASRGTEPR
jgi:hypothetical protein